MAQPIKKSAIVDKLAKAEQAAIAKAIDEVNASVNSSTTFPINITFGVPVSPVVWNKVIELFREAGWKVTVVPSSPNNPVGYREFILE